MFLRNVGSHKSCTALYPRRPQYARGDYDHNEQLDLNDFSHSISAFILFWIVQAKKCVR